MKACSLLVAALSSFLAFGGAYAGSATWNSAPGSSDWNTAANWTPATVPNGPGDVATFDFSNATSLTLSGTAEVAALVFTSGAPAYMIDPEPGAGLTISGTGIANDSGQLQTFMTMVDSRGNQSRVEFANSAAGGTSTAFVNRGGPVAGAGTSFFDTATADHGAFANEDGSVYGGVTQFFDSSTAGNGTFVNRNSQISLGGSGHTFFFNRATAGHATFTNLGGQGNGFLFGGSVVFSDRSSADESFISSSGSDFLFGDGGHVAFDDSSTAGHATAIANGGMVGATIDFIARASAGDATLIANGGAIRFQDFSTGGTSRIKLFGAGTLVMDFRSDPTVTIGSLEGDGQVYLGTNSLAIGSNDLNTTFAGLIDGTGSVTKLGHGKLTLSSASTYSGGTVIKGGALLVANSTGSATGTGSVHVNRGLLGGAGRIGGSVTIGNGTHVGASLSPGLEGANPAALVLQRMLTFRSLGACKITLNSTNPAADEVIAKGVTIESDATVFLQDIGAGTIAPGTVFTILNNTSASPIAGTFANLADGSTLNLNGNNFLASYEGGDGNDLTLTVL